MSLEALINQHLVNELSPAARDYALMLAEALMPRIRPEPARVTLPMNSSGATLSAAQSRPADGTPRC